MRFLTFFIAYKNDPLVEASIPKSRKEWEATYNGLIEATNSNLHGVVKDSYLAHLLYSIIKHKKNIFKPEWIELINNDELVAALNDSFSAKSILKGQHAPYFYLSDSSSAYHEIETYKGNIILINFWATWCKPCFELFPLENELVERFKDDDVVIINICLDSNREKWREVIKKYNLKMTNLLAEGNWNDKLKEDYEIDALPHSVLIDWSGNIHLNKSSDASSGVNVLIEELLLEMAK
jgi:thiol-disulfide isomerase/thioredoxin